MIDTALRPRSRPCGPFALALAAALLLIQLMVPLAGPVRAAGPGDADPALYEPVVPAERDAIVAATAGELTRYRIDATFTPALGSALATIGGTVELRYVNTTGESQSSLYLRLYPNGAEYADGAMTLGTVRAGLRTIAPALSVDDTVAELPLASPVADGAALDLTIGFTTTIPTDPRDSYGMFAFDRASGTYALAHWLPLLAGYDPSDGWLLDPLSRNGDPVFTNAALFDVTVTAPPGYVLATTGSQVGEQPDGDGVAHHLVSGPVRDFVMAIDDDFQVVSQRVGETTVNSYFQPGADAGGQDVLTYGAQSLAVFERLFGPYPYAELDLAQVELGNGAGGVEFPQLMFIGGSYYQNRDQPELVPGFLEFIVAHEVAHQWWYGLVGNNQYQHAFIDEGLANYATVLYFAEQYGAEAGHQQGNYNLRAPYFNVLFNGGDQVVDQPTDDFPSMQSYGAIIYGKGALGFEALDEEIGHPAFLAGLQAYAKAFQFGVATPADMRAAFEQAAGQDLGAFWTHWFERAEGRQDFDAADLARLLRELQR